MTTKEQQEHEEAIRSMFAGGGEQKDKRAKILEKVRAILALADGEQLTNPEAADNYRAQADDLMTTYAIEQWQIDQAQAKLEERTKPEARDFDFSWWRYSTRKDELWTMFHDVARHCRCVVATRGYGAGGKWNTIPVIGLPSDLDYFDLLFTHLMLQMGRQLEPKPEPGLSFEENAYRLRASGMVRRRLVTLLYEAKMIPGCTEPPYTDEVGNQIPYRVLLRDHDLSRVKKLGAKVRAAGEKYAKDNGLDTTKRATSAATWQRSFAIGFVREVGDRLDDMRRLQEEKPSTGPSVALAVRDIRQVALELYEELYPKPEPVEPSKEVTKSKRRTHLPSRDTRIDYSAIRKGRKAGREADLQASPQRGLKHQKELGK